MKRPFLSSAHCVAFLMAASVWWAAPAMAADFIVNDAGDAPDANIGDGICATAGNVCTLRAAIQEGNAVASKHSIYFNLGATTISPLSALPTVQQEVEINGYGQGATTPANDGHPNTLAVGSDAVLRIRLDGASAGAGTNGLTFGTGSTGAVLRGLSITGFDGSGISIGSNQSYIEVAGNFIGVSPAGAQAANAMMGVLLQNGASHITIGGPNPADRNVIASNAQGAITLWHTTSTANTVRNNYLGTSPSGLARLGTGSHGVRIEDAVNTDILDNVIAAATGIALFSAAPGTRILGNRIGVGADDTTPIGDASGSSHGVRILGSTPAWVSNVLIGSTLAGEGNHIAYWGGNGVDLDRLTASDNAPTTVLIRGNAIHDNGGLGIDLADSVTGTGVQAPNPNDLNDADTGANAFQNFPVATAATTDGSTTTVSLTYDSFASGGFWIDVYASPSCDASGHGEGQQYLGTASLNSDATGHLSSTLTGLPATTVGHYITLTATDIVGWNTSEFSACLAISGTGATPPVMGDLPNQTATVGTPLSLNLAAYVSATEGDAITAYAVTGTLPPGLSLDTSTGLISGTPTASGSWTVSFTASDDDGTSNADSVTFTIRPETSTATINAVPVFGPLGQLLTMLSVVLIGGLARRSIAPVR